MTRKFGQRRDDSTWHVHVKRLSILGLLGLVLAAIPNPALAAGAGEICGRLNWWSESCDEGLECEQIWRWRRWSIGACVEVQKRCGGDLPEQCDETEYCAFEEPGTCGAADEPGVCEPRPEVCTEEYAPVCGCDGMSYDNACFANSSGTAVQSEGPCLECDYEDPTRTWVARDAESCSRVRFDCDPGSQAFFDDCGCGCEPGPEVCEYDGVSYRAGATFPAGDGCNECTCMEDGNVQCTLALCTCDYEDPNRRWLQTDAQQCGSVRFDCEVGTQPFTDECGCGCELGPDECEYEGISYPIDATFPATDGCNDCTCMDGGNVQCTNAACACDYENPNRRWIQADAAQCGRVRFDCEIGAQPFSDECGCGCEIVPADECEYDGMSYPIDATFPATDGCNECTCTEDGSVLCTDELCACDYEDPARSWVSQDPAECATILFLCVEGQLPFSNDCGCGCEPACRVAGCSGQLCVTPYDDGISTCEFREEYACYADAICALQPDGNCGFTPTDELAQCIEQARASEEPGEVRVP